MNKDFILLNLKEALEELVKTIEEIEKDNQFDFDDYYVNMRHLYHHLNFAWNIRNEKEKDIEVCSRRDFLRWELFPQNFDMDREQFVLDGSNFDSIETFYDEVEKVLTKDLDWKIGRNLNALDDVLYGEFGEFGEDYPITIIWKNSEKSKNDLKSAFDEIIEIIKEHKNIDLILE